MATESMRGMISRVADHCFWFGRYLERTESVARVLAVTRNLALDAELAPGQCWLPVLIVAGEEPDFVKRFGRDATDRGDTVERYMAWDEEAGSSIRRSVESARENARSIREVVSIECWEVTNELHLWLHDTGRREFEAHRYGFYRHVRNQVQLCLGFLRSTMLHDTPLWFSWLGVLLERTSQTARLLDVHHHAITESGVHQVVETALWLSLLRACSGFEPYMKRHQGRVTQLSVAAFLLFEPRFPRSVRYCVRSAYDLLATIRPPSEPDLPGGRSLERLRALDAVLQERAEEPLDNGSVHDLLTHVVDEIHGVCDEIGRELLGSMPEPVSAPPVPAETNA